MGIKNFKVGRLEKGKKNLITDVDGVRVGHVTLADGDIQTGVTAILPSSENIFQNKLMAASYVINGFGKTTGLIQINELGTIESPIILTNTLSVGVAYNALVKYMLEQNEDIGDSTGTVNPIVCECNDGRLNNIRGLNIREEHIFQAIEKADNIFEEGAVGAGKGMVSYGLSAGIGSASRTFQIDESKYTLGALVLSNHGRKADLVINGKNIGKSMEAEDEERDKGSIIIILATDVPLSERQLGRICKRVPIALGRNGSFIGNGSGEIVIAFTTANKIPHYPVKKLIEISFLHDDYIDLVFRATVEAVEEAVLSSLYYGEKVKGFRKREIKGLKDYIKNLDL